MLWVTEAEQTGKGQEPVCPKLCSQVPLIISTFVDVCPASAPAPASGRAVTEQTALGLVYIAVSF